MVRMVDVLREKGTEQQVEVLAAWRLAEEVGRRLEVEKAYRQRAQRAKKLGGSDGRSGLDGQSGRSVRPAPAVAAVAEPDYGPRVALVAKPIKDVPRQHRTVYGTGS